ncbi:neutral trehalase [Haematobacter massiliensis]|uniref:MGH1-like glycoside hydrolase domain-containing protein n=1 Tax=Haematobacter massiliensis TaxID=195105 RepID=UPI000B49F179|nr:neutral trehalase [Haematobacter massiliensis]OWJ70368.1 neutral trehalase [Haematobacter massiliensis]
MTTDYIAAAKAVLARNDRGGYTLPTDRLYPFQWNWDSAFVAMGFATYDVDRGCRELERLAEGQWPDGMIPHIVFHQPSDSYYPGPEVWRTHNAVATSGITQPPVFGMAVRVLHERGAPHARIRPLFEAALRWHRWWYSARDPEGTGLVALLHPWESGSDNSPAWDEALSRVPTTTREPVRRKDTGHVDPSMRPRDEDYQRFIHLVDTYADCDWEPARQWAAAPFRMGCVQTTAILLKAGEDLLTVAEALALPEAAEELRAMTARCRAALLSRWSPGHRRFLIRDLIAEADVITPTQAGFLPLLALDLPADIRDAAVAEMRRWMQGLRVAFPTTPADCPAYEPRRYWRGPVWPVIDWLLAAGLDRNGVPELADALRSSVSRAMETAGFVEYFHPGTGEGLGGQGFSWSAAAYLHFRSLSA